MKILVVSRNKVETRLVTQQLSEHKHEVHVASGYLTALSRLGSDDFDFVLVIESPDDVYTAKEVVNFARKTHTPFLRIQGGKNVLDQLPNRIAPNVYAYNDEVVAQKCVSTLTCVSSLVDQSCTYWAENWGTVKHAAC